MKNISIRRIATSSNEPATAGRFKIRSVADLLGEKDLIHELHRHDFFFILALNTGMGIHEIDFTQYEINNKSVFFIRPGQVHQLELKAGSSRYLLEFDTAFYHPTDNLPSQRLLKASHKNVCDFDESQFKKLVSLLAYIFDEYNTKQEGYIEVIKANLDVFFIEYIRQSRTPDGTSKIVSSYAQERLEDFLALLGAHITDKKHVSEYATLLNISPYQLNAVTKTTMGKSASEMISEQIILEAKRYLLASPSQIKDIADKLGYEDISYFIRFFKRHTGYSPEAFRKNFN